MPVPTPVKRPGDRNVAGRTGRASAGAGRRPSAAIGAAPIRQDPKTSEKAGGTKVVKEGEWSPPARATTLRGKPSRAIAALGLLALAAAAAVVGIWIPVLLAAVLPLLGGGAWMLWNWRRRRITLDPQGVTIGRILGRPERITFSEMGRVRFLRFPRAKGRYGRQRSARLAHSLRVPFESPQRLLRGSLFQVWIERRGATEVRLDLDFLGRMEDIRLLYEGLPHAMAPELDEPTGPGEAPPRWW